MYNNFGGEELKSLHTFHIPVMGLGYTVDTPIHVAPYGISSTISIVDDGLIEKFREFYCKKWNISYEPISEKIADYRAKRITSYLNVVDKIVKNKVDQLKRAVAIKGSELEKYADLLPDFHEVKEKIREALATGQLSTAVSEWIHQHLHTGSIDVNIMTKLDQAHYDSNGDTDIKMNDAHAALRGYANSELVSSLVLSAGMSPRLYSYLEEFPDFYPDANGNLRKKIILKVSDFRSATIQGKMLAKKGLWISEYRIESGLNCGGHTFPSDGFLMGPILDEFRLNREQLITNTHEEYKRGLEEKGYKAPEQPLKVTITAQGGVGTHEEHEFLRSHYNIDSVGWGSPFLLVPEVVSIDKDTLTLLANAGEKDVYLSNVSPLGVKFNNVYGASMSVIKHQRAEAGKPGAPCVKKYLTYNTEYTERPICTSSKLYQSKKIAELKAKNLPAEEYKKAYEKLIDPECLCVGLGISALKSKGIDTPVNEGVTICPGPNIAYFSKVMTLKEMVDHIYGRINLITHPNRPNMFIKELSMYVTVLKERIENMVSTDIKETKTLKAFKKNLLSGIAYYKSLFEKQPEICSVLDEYSKEIDDLLAA